jgi:formate/nitrite transporter FocA (FNT family)
MTDGDVPEPETIYERTKKEGERRLHRPVLELAATACAAGFDIVAGVLALALVDSQLEHLLGRDAAHVFGSVAFGIGFVFLIVGRGELYTENFLVPIAGAEEGGGEARLKLVRLWLISPVCNILAALVVIVILTVHSTLPFGTGASVNHLAATIHANGVLALFMSSLFAGALITAMTWFVEGQETMIVRVVVGWMAGFILALASLNHVIVVTIELIFGYRFGADIPWLFILGNFALAGIGNLIGGVGLITLTRLTQGKQGGSQSSSA